MKLFGLKVTISVIYMIYIGYIIREINVVVNSNIS